MEKETYRNIDRYAYYEGITKPRFVLRVVKDYMSQTPVPDRSVKAPDLRYDLVELFSQSEIHLAAIKWVWKSRGHRKTKNFSMEKALEYLGYAARLVRCLDNKYVFVSPLKGSKVKYDMYRETFEAILTAEKAFVLFQGGLYPSALKYAKKAWPIIRIRYKYLTEELKEVIDNIEQMENQDGTDDNHG